MWWWVLACCSVASAALGVTLGDVPRPAAGAWSVDMTRTLAPQTLAEVDRLGNALVSEGHGQLAVVVVDTTGRRPPREFALALFNQWGIGTASRHDGALLFIALNDRAAEIILGDRVDGPSDQARSDDIMASGVVPAFKRGSPDDAVLAGARGLHQLIKSSELNQPSSETATACDAAVEENPWAAPIDPHDDVLSVTFVPSASGKEAELNVPAVAGGLGLLGAAGVAGRALLRRRPRRCQKCRNPRTRLDEDADDAHLKPGEVREEQLGSVDYDVWWCESCQDALVERYGALFTRHARCPKCRFVTASKTSRTIRRATTTRGGEVEITVQCKHCSHRAKSRRTTARLSQSSSSSSSSRSSSSGGGRSSGGGSSGRW